MDSTTLMIIIGSVLLVSLFMYITARIRMTKDKLVLTAGRMDVTFLMITPLFAIIGALVARLTGVWMPAYIMWFIAFVCVALSIMYSIIENKDSGLDMAFSIGAKIFIIITSFFIVSLSLIIFLGYMIYFLITEHNNPEAEDEKGKLALPQYRKFMNAYVGLKEEKTKKTGDVETKK